MSEKVLYEVNNNIATITLNRPKALNALNNDMISDILKYLRESGEDRDVRVIIIQGNGRAFCAGDDLVDMGTEDHPNPDDKLLEYRQGYPEIVRQLRATEKPIICKIHKYALGAGFEIALAADIVVAASETKIGLPFVLRGIAAGTYLLQNAIGYQKACEYLFTGELFTVEEGKEFGIINNVVVQEQLDEEVNQVAEKLSKGATRAIGLMKLAMNNSAAVNLQKGMDEQVYATTLGAHTHDFKEGKQAFLEKRDPVFKGK